MGDTWIPSNEDFSLECGTPIAPYDGSYSDNYLYNIDQNTLTLNGDIFIVLPAELLALRIDKASSIAYEIIDISDQTLTLSFKSVYEDSVYYTTFELTCTDDCSETGAENFIDAFPLDASEWRDSDEDGVGHNTDNCLLISNPEQINTDGDSAGDACDAFTKDATETLDTDGDSVGDNTDVFINNPSEWADEDGDGTGDNSDNCLYIENAMQINSDGDSEGNACDIDDDNDGFTDKQEEISETNPYNALSCIDCYSVFDIDADGKVEALTDGLMIIRYIFGFTDDALINNAMNIEGARNSAEEIEAYIESHMP